MNWAEMTPFQRDALVGEKIFGHRSVNWSGLMVILKGELPLGGALPKYTTSMDAAWLVMQHLASQINPENIYDYEPFIRFTNALFSTENEELYTKYAFMAGDIAKWTPDRICLAALRAVGVEIERE